MSVKTKAAVWIMVVCLLAFSACGAPKEPLPQSTATPSPFAGFRMDDDVLAGGGAPEKANAKLLLLDETGDLTTITLKFVSGSQLAGDEEEEPAEGVPAYRIYTLPSPARLVVEFANLDHWDFDRAAQPEKTSLIFGQFVQFEESAGTLRVYFQLTDEAAFRAEERQDQLQIELKPLPREHEEAFYVTVNAFEKLAAPPENSGLSPQLCDDLFNIVLISRPYSTADEAEEARERFRANPSLQALTLAGDTWDVISLRSSALPVYNAQLDYQYVAEKPAARKDGALLKLPVIMPDGLYLCSSPDGSQLFSKSIPADETDAGESEYLWLVDASGKTKRLTDFEFTGIAGARFSPDGKRLAILDQLQENIYLYILNMDSGELLNIGEEGFGAQTSAFVWDSLGSAIYAVSGNETQELHCYDFTIPDESKRHYAVSDYEITGSDIGYANGYIYFSNIQEDNTSKVFRIRPEGGPVMPVASGGDFLLTPDGRYMITHESLEGELSNRTVVKLYDLQQGTDQTILSSDGIYASELSSDGKTLFFIESDELSALSNEPPDESGDGGADPAESADAGPTPEASPSASTPPAAPAQVLTDEYPFRLSACDLTSGAITPLMDVISSEIHPAPQPGQLYLHYLDSTGAQTFRATYLLEISDSPTK